MGLPNEQNITTFGLDPQLRGAAVALWDASGRAGTLRDFTAHATMPDGRRGLLAIQIDGVGMEEILRICIDSDWLAARDIASVGPWSWQMRVGNLRLEVDGEHVTVKRI